MYFGEFFLRKEREEISCFALIWSAVGGNFIHCKKNVRVVSVFSFKFSTRKSVRMFPKCCQLPLNFKEKKKKIFMISEQWH